MTHWLDTNALYHVMESKISSVNCQILDNCYQGTCLQIGEQEYTMSRKRPALATHDQTIIELSFGQFVAVIAPDGKINVV